MKAEKSIAPSRKKAYRRPELVRFGSLAQLTRVHSNMGIRDGGTGKFMAS
jgi:hypothetical protein